MGFLERVAAGDPPTSALHAKLAPVVEELVVAGVIPRRDPDYAVLLWITVFDERVIVDLAETLAWRAERIARTLTASLMAAWAAPEPA